MILQQSLGLNAANANAYIASAPVLLAIGLNEDAAMRLRAALVGAGAFVSIQGPPPPPPPAEEKARPPKPEPVRKMAATMRTLREIPERRGLRTVTGLAIGRTFSYLAYARAEGRRLVAPPDFIRFDARILLPTALKPAGGGSGETVGLAALAQWPRYPEDVRIGFLTEMGKDDGQSVITLRSYLKAMAFRLAEVLGPDSLDAHSGSETNISIDPEWADDMARLLATTAEDAGFPVARVVPDPLAALSFNLQKGLLKAVHGVEHIMVVDWGGQGLSISFIERCDDKEPVVFDTTDFPMGGMWLDMIIENWLRQKLPEELPDEDRRALTLFAHDFKEEASRSFADGRTEHVQYCVTPAGTPPTRLVITRSEMESLLKDAKEQLQKILVEAVVRIGFKPEHLDQILLVGGGARWYFAREAVRTALGRVPLMSPQPEESIARGLAVSGMMLGKG